MAQTLFTDRLIGFFDILGFSARLQRMPLSELHAKYADYIDAATNAAFTPRELLHTTPQQRKQNFEIAKFIFDSVIVVSRPLTDPHAAHDFILATGLLYELGVINEMPLRGAIGRGDYLDDNERSIFLSNVFPDLVKAERAQEWSGCHLLPDAEKPVLDALYNLHIVETGQFRVSQSNPLVYYQVPFKKESSRANNDHRWCLNWCSLKQDHPDFNRGLSYLSGVKNRETLAFVKYVLSLPDNSMALTNEFLPAVKVRMQGTRWGIRITFSDSQGNPAQPKTQFRLEIF